MEDKTAMDKLCDNLNNIITGERLDIHVKVDDPAGNSYIQVCYYILDFFSLSVFVYV